MTYKQAKKDFKHLENIKELNDQVEYMAMLRGFLNMALWSGLRKSQKDTNFKAKQGD